MTISHDIRSSADTLRKLGASTPRVGLVLGSGLGAFGDRVDKTVDVPYSEIPGFPMSSVVGHAGRFLAGTVNGTPVAVLQGRVHAYEGHPWIDVVRPVRVLAALGVRGVVLTNAAGGVNAAFRPGDLMRITDHLNLTGGNPLVGANEDELGPRFPDMTHGYAENVGSAIEAAALQVGVALKRGVYAGLLGPTYETPAEIRMVRTLGADAVGMSTVAESIALNHMGVSVGGISCITNLAAGISTQPLSHDEVTETAARVRDDFVQLLEAAVPLIHAAVGD